MDKTCSACGETKPISEFYFGKKQCKVCYKAVQKAYRQTDAGKENNRQKFRKWREDNLELAREMSRNANRKARARDPRRFLTYGLRYLYGITMDQYDALLAQQSGGCAICGTSEPGGKGMFHVDHCHDTGKVRGLLCNECNMGIGKLKDSADLLARAASYLAEGGREG